METCLKCKDLEQELAFVKTQWKQTSDLLEQERNRLTAELADVRNERDEFWNALANIPNDQKQIMNVAHASLVKDRDQAVKERDELKRELSEASEMIDVWKSRSEINGKIAMKLQDERDTCRTLAEKLSAALESARDWVSTHAMQTYSRVARKEVEEIDELLAEYREFLKERE